MPDQKTVLTWLEICGKNRDCSACCPYGDGTGEDEMSTCRENLMADALALLKEQEPMRVLSQRECETLPNHYERKGFCPKCNQVVEWYLNRLYCGFCGQAVKWDV